MTLAAEAAEPLIERLLALPAGFRRFTATSREAAIVFGLDDDDVRALVHAGLPCVGRGQDARFDPADLHFVGVRTGTAKAHLSAERLMARLLADVGACPSARFRVEYLPQLDDGGVPATVVLPDGGERSVTLEPRLPAAEIGLEPAAPDVTPPPAVADALESLRAYDWYQLPDELVGNVDRARETRLVECVTAAQLLAEELRMREVTAREAHGLALSIPFAAAHSWVEVELEGRWVGFSPLLIAILVEFGDLNADAWTRSSSPQQILLRFERGRAPVLTSAAGPVPTWFRVRRAD